MNRAQRRAAARGRGPARRFFRLDLTPEEAEIAAEAMDTYILSIPLDEIQDDGVSTMAHAVATAVRNAIESAMEKRGVGSLSGPLRLFRLEIDPNEAAIFEEALVAYVLSIQEEGGDDDSKMTAARMARAIRIAVEGRIRLPEARKDGKSTRRAHGRIQSRPDRVAPQKESQ